MTTMLVRTKHRTALLRNIRRIPVAYSQSSRSGVDWAAWQPGTCQVGWLVRRCLKDDSGCIVLHTLRLLDATDWRIVEYRVAVVQSRQNQTAGQCVCQIIVFAVNSWAQQFNFTNN